MGSFMPSLCWSLLLFCLLRNVSTKRGKEGKLAISEHLLCARLLTCFVSFIYSLPQFYGTIIVQMRRIRQLRHREVKGLAGGKTLVRNRARI